jgi:hypothetical protein
MKLCKGCKQELNDSRFYYLGFLRKSGKKALSSYCKPCDCLRANPNKKKNYYTPRINKNKDVLEDVFIEFRQIYLLIKRIEINGLNMSYIDSFRLIDQYIKVFGDNIPDFYSETEQLDIMFFRLKEYINIHA